MSEYGLSTAQQNNPTNLQSFAQPRTQVEWYSVGAQHQYADYRGYDQSYQSGSAAAYGSFEDEAPLLEELGIDISAILSRTKSILTFSLSSRDVDSLDLGGPLIYMSLLAVCHLLVGKLHFGYILGWSIVASILIWFVLSSVAGPDPSGKTLDLYTCCCLLGYSLLPLVLHAIGTLLLPHRSTVSLSLAALAVIWSGQTAARLFVHRSMNLQGQLAIVMYPCLLMYSALALLTLY